MLKNPIYLLEKRAILRMHVFNITKNICSRKYRLYEGCRSENFPQLKTSTLSAQITTFATENKKNQKQIFKNSS